MRDDLEERREMIVDFLNEGRELLDEIEPLIIGLEKEAANSGLVDLESINAIFRLFHSLKGLASFLDLQTVMKVTHEAETLLDIFRKGQMQMQSSHGDLLCRTSDFIRGLMDAIEANLHDEGHEEAAQALMDEIRQVIESLTSSPAPGEEGAKEEEQFQFTLSPEMLQRFIEDAQGFLEEGEMALLKLEGDPQDQEAMATAFRALHNFKGNAGLCGFGDLEKVSHAAESLLGEYRDGKGKLDSQRVSSLLMAIDGLREGIKSLEGGGGASLPQKETILALLGGKGEAQPRQDSSGGVTPPASGGREEKGEESREDGKRKGMGLSQQGIRVDVEKLEALIDLVGELVIAEAMVSHNPDLQGMQLNRFDKAVAHLSKITRNIQDVAMSLRMVPLAGTFRKMVRLVRDTALKAGKKVELEIIGEETEVDKTIIEQISDPLVHIIRNAVDHGIEKPEERKALGKPETGRVTLEAKHSAGEVWIIIKDDGKGLNREKILKKAMEKGLIRDKNREYKDEEVWKLIFEPGLSTAEQVSSLSGRGVGMDVVKRNIEKLRGRVEIQSQPGQGTVLAIRIPLTLAIIEGMVVQVGQARYTVPIASIRQSLKPLPDQITLTPNGLEIVRIRGELLPVIRLHDIYKVKPIYEELPQGILVVVESESAKACLFVDELIGQQQIVIKGLPEYLGNVRGVSGVTILGDGEVSMILDIAKLMDSLEGLLEEGQVWKNTG